MLLRLLVILDGTSEILVNHEFSGKCFLGHKTETQQRTMPRSRTSVDQVHRGGEEGKEPNIKNGTQQVWEWQTINKVNTI